MACENAYIFPTVRRVRGLEKNFQICGIEEIEKRYDVSEIFSTHEWDSNSNSNRAAPLTVAFYGRQNALDNIYRVLSHGYFDIEKRSEAPVIVLNMCEFTEDLLTGEGPKRLSQIVYKFIKGCGKHGRPIIFMKNFHSCVQKEGVLLLNLFLDPWNGRRAFVESPEGDQIDATKAIWVLLFEGDEILSSADVHNKISEAWRYKRGQDSRITGEAYVGRLSHVVSVSQDNTADAVCKSTFQKISSVPVGSYLSGDTKAKERAEMGGTNWTVNILAFLILCIVLVLWTRKRRGAPPTQKKYPSTRTKGPSKPSKKKKTDTSPSNAPIRNRSKSRKDRKR